MAVQQLLEMGDADAPPPTDAMLAGNIDSDEELAMKLFRQFADEMGPQLGVLVPDNVRNDPQLYEAFVREHFQRELARPDSQVTARANQALESNQTLRNQFEQRGGRQGFLERMKAAVAGGGRAQVSVVAGNRARSRCSPTTTMGTPRVEIMSTSRASGEKQERGAGGAGRVGGWGVGGRVRVWRRLFQGDVRGATTALFTARTLLRSRCAI